MGSDSADFWAGVLITDLCEAHTFVYNGNYTIVFLWWHTTFWIVSQSFDPSAIITNN